MQALSRGGRIARLPIGFRFHLLFPNGLADRTKDPDSLKVQNHSYLSQSFDFDLIYKPSHHRGGKGEYPVLQIPPQVNTAVGKKLKNQKKKKTRGKMPLKGEGAARSPETGLARD